MNEQTDCFAMLSLVQPLNALNHEVQYSRFWDTSQSTAYRNFGVRRVR